MAGQEQTNLTTKSHFKPLWSSSWPLSQVDFQLIMHQTTWLTGHCAGDASLSLSFTFLHFNNGGEWLMINQMTLCCLTLNWHQSLNSFCMLCILLEKKKHHATLSSVGKLCQESFYCALLARKLNRPSIYVCTLNDPDALLTQRFQEILEIFRRLHFPFSWEICDLLLHFDASSLRDYYYLFFIFLQIRSRWWLQALRLESVRPSLLNDL